MSTFLLSVSIDIHKNYTYYNKVINLISNEERTLLVFREVVSFIFLKIL